MTDAKRDALSDSLPTTAAPERRAAPRYFFGTLALALALAAAWFGGLRLLLMAGDGAVEPLVDQYFQQFNSGDYAGMYSTAHSSLTSETSPETFAAKVDRVRSVLGDFKRKTVRGVSIAAERGGAIAQATYDAEFANGPATVEFTFVGSGSEQGLADVSFRSSLLPDERRRGRR